MDIYTFLVMLHVIGTILGTGGATVAELQIARALKDKRVSMDERALMHVNYGMIRAGMAIVLVSVLGMFWYFEAQGSDVLFTNEKLWIKDLMFLMVFLNAFALQKRLVPLWLGASISFTSWWGATLLGLAGQLPYSFTTYLVGYVIAIFAIAGLFHLLRLWRAMGILNTRTTILSFGIILAAVAVIVFQLIQGEQAREAALQAASEEVAAEYRMLTEVVTFEYPGGTHNIEFKIAVDDSGVIQHIAGADINPDNQGKIADFVVAVNELLVGETLSEVETLGKVGTASLTTAAFNESIAKMQAKL
ncbi:hypothetical protein H6778_01075 [Candidatus Nomurabacteria bacterium]|nr:hypothetical protein [Candidatus Nomurabacteria bacterium]